MNQLNLPNSDNVLAISPHFLLFLLQHTFCNLSCAHKIHTRTKGADVFSARSQLKLCGFPKQPQNQVTGRKQTLVQERRHEGGRKENQVTAFGLHVYLLQRLNTF